MSKLVDLKGKRFNWLVVLERSKNKGIATYWKCQCDCGKIKDIASSSLIRGISGSCGCYFLEGHNGATHGHARNNKITSEYASWKSMKQRCLETRNISYKWYGARGITICDRWVKDFDDFMQDMGKKPSKKHSLERINNDEGYYPTNCKWVLPKEQSRNRRNTLKAKINGTEKPLVEWAEITGIPYPTLVWRFKKGLKEEEIIKNSKRA